MGVLPGEREQSSAWDALELSAVVRGEHDDVEVPDRVRDDGTLGLDSLGRESDGVTVTFDSYSTLMDVLRDEFDTVAVSSFNAGAIFVACARTADRRASESMY